MADARQRGEWDRTLSLMAFVGSMLGDKPARPIDLIPVRYRPRTGPREPVTPADRERRNRETWRAFDTFFGHDTSGE